MARRVGRYYRSPAVSWAQPPARMKLPDSEMTIRFRIDARAEQRRRIGVGPRMPCLGRASIRGSSTMNVEHALEEPIGRESEPESGTGAPGAAMPDRQLEAGWTGSGSLPAPGYKNGSAPDAASAPRERSTAALH